MTAPLVTGLGTGPFTSGGQELLELVAAGGQLEAVQSSSLDAWVTDPSNPIYPDIINLWVKLDL